jgi:chromate reductase, NAD(P)H dehydrogenase (quinone)
MDTYRLLLIGGSLRVGSVNTAVLRTAAAIAPSGVIARVYGGLRELPAFDPDDDRQPLHPAVAALRDRLHWADAVLMSTPEYAGSLPGAFKNLLDWTVGDGMYEMPVGWVNPSTSVAGARYAYDSLRRVLGFVNAEIVEAACVDLPVPRSTFGPDGVIGDQAIRAGLGEVLSALVLHVAAVRRRD